MRRVKFAYSMYAENLTFVCTRTNIPEGVILICFKKSLNVRCAWVEEEEKHRVGEEGRRHLQRLEDG